MPEMTHKDLTAFLDAIVQPEGEYALEIRALEHKGPGIVQEFFPSPPDQDFLEALEHEGYNIYFGVAPRRKVDGKFSGMKRNCTRPRCLFLDFDNVADIDKWEAEFDQIRADHNLPPYSALVHSGGGLHVYWLLNKRPFKDVWEPRQEKMVKLFPDSDQQVKNMDRILRLPGYMNHKRRRPAELLFSDYSRTYDINLFPMLTSQDSRASSDGRSKFLKQDKFGAGERDDFLFSYALNMWKKYLNQHEVSLLVHDANDNRCVPPCPADDVDEKIKNAKKYYTTNVRNK